MNWQMPDFAIASMETNGQNIVPVRKLTVVTTLLIK